MFGQSAGEQLPPPARAGSWFLDVAVGYGYRTWRALVALLAIIGLGPESAWAPTGLFFELWCAALFRE